MLFYQEMIDKSPEFYLTNYSLELTGASSSVVDIIIFGVYYLLRAVGDWEESSALCTLQVERRGMVDGLASSLRLVIIKARVVKLVKDDELNIKQAWLCSLYVCECSRVAC